VTPAIRSALRLSQARIGAMLINRSGADPLPHRSPGKPIVMATFPELIALLQQVEAGLRQCPWFSDKWRIDVCLSPDEVNPTCVALQLYKANWFNEDLRGVHFETWLSPQPLAIQQVPMVLHVLHKKTFPGGKDCDAFSKPFVNDPAVKTLVGSWAVYKLNNGGMTPFRAYKQFNEHNLVPSLVQEFTRVIAVAPHIDKYLAALPKA
jgi:hypothetical protein